MFCPECCMGRSCVARMLMPGSSRSTAKRLSSCQAFFSVVTGADFPAPINDFVTVVGENRANARHLSYNVMAHDKVLYDGHAVAAVAASSPHVAGEALRQIEVEDELLPPVMTLDDAMKPDAPILLLELREKHL